MLRFLLLAVLVAAAAATKVTMYSGSDSTMVPGSKGADVVERTVEVIKTSCIFDDDKLFMRRLAYVESFDGADTDTYRTGYDGGIWQVDQVMFSKLKETPVRTALSKYTKLFKSALGVNWETTKWEDCRKPRVSALAARLYIQWQMDKDKKTFPRDIPDQGDSWAKYYRNGSDKNIFITAAKKLNQGCKQIYGVDLVFVLDGSGSVGSANFNAMKNFVKKVVDSFTVGPNATKVSVLKYSNAVTTEFYLNRYSTKSAVMSAIDGIKYKGGGTNTHLALSKLLTVFSSNGARPKSAGVPRVGIFLTDGQSANAGATISNAKKVHDADITMFAIGVGSNIRKSELEAIASDPECLYLFMLDGFSEVEALKYAIEKGTCDAPVIVGPGKDGTEVDGKVPSGGDQNCKIKVPDAGTTVKINALTGGVKFFVSDNTYPSESYYDAMVNAVPGAPGVIFVAKPQTQDKEGIIFCNIKGDKNVDSDVDVGILPGDKDFCDGVVCQHGGKCVDNLKNGYVCLCASGYEGTHCENVIDPCQKNPCIKGACQSTNDGAFTCTCKPGWKGTLCNEPETSCSLDPCKHGNCTSLGSRYECCCEPGYTGVNCDIEIDECQSNPCIHGKCLNQIGKYVCICEDGYIDYHCDVEVNECDSNPCAHGDCIDKVNGYECKCPPGWEGRHCEINIDDCTPNPCVNGACQDEVNRFICLCNPGWTGEKCDTNIDECASNPCGLHGSCVDGNNGYKCICDSGWTGIHCTKDVDECESSPCIHGDCKNGVNKYTCICHPGYEGTNCEIDTDECSSNPCQNGGTCQDRTNKYICICAPGYEGEHCEIDIDDCKDDPCEHGTCRDMVNDYHCTCHEGWKGTNCDCVIDNCATAPCINGICVNAIGGYTCSCNQGFSGQNCDNGGTPPPSGKYDCRTQDRNPCTAANRAKGLYHFPHVYPNKFVQCDQIGRCFVKDCRPGLVWDPVAITCNRP